MLLTENTAICSFWIEAVWIVGCLFENAQGKMYFILPLRHQESICHTNSSLMAFRHRSGLRSPDLARTPGKGNLFGTESCRMGHTPSFSLAKQTADPHAHRLRAARRIFSNTRSAPCATWVLLERPQFSLFVCKVFVNLTHVHEGESGTYSTQTGHLMC